MYSYGPLHFVLLICWSLCVLFYFESLHPYSFEFTIHCLCNVYNIQWPVKINHAGVQRRRPTTKLSTKTCLCPQPSNCSHSRSNKQSRKHWRPITRCESSSCIWFLTRIPRHRRPPLPPPDSEPRSSGHFWTWPRRTQRRRECEQKAWNWMRRKSRLLLH